MEEVASERRQLERRNEDRRKVERISVRSLLALLAAGAAAVLSAIALWLHIDGKQRLSEVRAQQTTLAADMERLRRDLQAAGERVELHAAQLQQLSQLAPRVDELADSMSDLRGRTEAGRRAWALAEARYLLEVANRNLTLDRNVESAIVALEAADARLRDLRDPGLNAVRSELAREVQALRAVVQPDVTGIAARLASAEELAGRLPVIGAIPGRYRPEETEREIIETGPARIWQLIRSSLTNMISIRRIGRDAVELVSLEEQNVRRQHLQLLLFAARLAAIRGDNALFHRNVAAAREWLTQTFDARHPGVASVDETLREVGEVNLAPPLPDISGSLRLLDRQAHNAQGRP